MKLVERARVAIRAFRILAMAKFLLRVRAEVRPGWAASPAEAVEAAAEMLRAAESATSRCKRPSRPGEPL